MNYRYTFGVHSPFGPIFYVMCVGSFMVWISHTHRGNLTQVLNPAAVLCIAVTYQLTQTQTKGQVSS